MPRKRTDIPARLIYGASDPSAEVPSRRAQASIWKKLPAEIREFASGEESLTNIYRDAVRFTVGDRIVDISILPFGVISVTTGQYAGDMPGGTV